MRFLVFLFITFSFLPSAFALDRVQLVQSRIHASISSILAPSDFLVIVNRLDSLDDGGGAQVVDGTIRTLPGLNLGVDSRGELIVSGQSTSSYNGPVAVQLMVDRQIRQETYRALEKMLPEIMGGLRDDDEVKMSQGPLRQPPIPVPGSQVQSSPSGSENPSNQMQENLKFLALLLLTGGLFFWFLSKINFPNNKKESQPFADRSGDAKLDDDAKKSAEVTAADFGVLDPHAVGLFLLKEVMEKRERIWFKWIKFAPAQHQREVFGTLPAWILSYLQDIGRAQKLDDKDLAEVSLHDLFNEIALIEKSFKTEFQKQKAFLQWFPVQAVRQVPRHAQLAIGEETKRTLWSLRPDLGNLVRIDGISAEEVMQEPSEAQIGSCVRELMALPSMSIDRGRADGQDIVLRWSTMINQLSEFSPIESQLEQAEFKLNKADFARLTKSVAHLKTPLAFDEGQRKEWLRNIEPHDYQWWLNMYKDTPPWDLKNDLRPMRLAMFNQSLEAAAWKVWSEDQRKESAMRVLNGFRKIIDPSWRNQELESA